MKQSSKEALKTAMTEQFGETIDDWFGDNSSYLVLQRALLSGMPESWQARMIGLLDELEETYDWSKIAGNFLIYPRSAEGKQNRINDDLRDFRNVKKLPYKVKAKRMRG